ncbi:MAG: hypothetical protein BroJett040_24140 [Oligoflexia bacterium]|nr:MAG: hypothetical protein BroJett040_24140 [Oligoflexia bacterium]
MKFFSADPQFFSEVPMRFSQIYSSVSAYDLASCPEVLGRESVLVLNGTEPKELISTFTQKKCWNIIQKNDETFVSDLEKAARLIEKPQLYFDAQAEYFVSEPQDMIFAEFNAPTDKERLKKTSEKFIENLKNQNVHESVNCIVEELYMNAVLDAPREAQQMGRFEHPYVHGQKAKMTLVRDDQALAISCMDPYGSLNIQKFIRRMDEVYQKGAGESLNIKRPGGAGLGCVIMFEHCSSMFLGVVPGKMTVVTCIIPLGLSYRQRAEVKKNLHLIEI